MSMSHIIALDVGAKRIGVAMASQAARLPQPYTVIAGGDTALDDIKDLIKTEVVDTVVVGLPRGLEGQETDQTRYVRAFVDKLKKQINVSVHLQDEALTSHEAEAELQARGRDYQKGDIDALAATIILSDYLSENLEQKHEN